MTADRVDIVALLEGQGCLKIAAPMVRYSKLPFRALVREYGCDLAFTPMIIAEGFNRSAKARNSDFSTNRADKPLVVQFATNDRRELVAAARRIEGYADAVDINCGCPQKWALKEGIGAAMSAEPELVHDLVKETRANTSIPVSIKIRLHKDMRRTLDLIRAAESAGAAWISVHGRTVEERTKVPVRLDAIRFVKKSVSIPVVANGDAFCQDDLARIEQETGVNGIMSARGILANPALFAGYDQVPLDCVRRYLELASTLGGKFIIHHRHLAFMLQHHLSKYERLEFQDIVSMAGIVDFFADRDWL